MREGGGKRQKMLEPVLDLCVSSLRRGHANLPSVSQLLPKSSATLPPPPLRQTHTTIANPCSTCPQHPAFGATEHPLLYTPRHVRTPPKAEPSRRLEP